MQKDIILGLNWIIHVKCSILNDIMFKKSLTIMLVHKKPHSYVAVVLAKAGI